MRDPELAVVKASLDGSWNDVKEWLVAGSVVLADVDDPLARHVSRQIDRAFEAMDLEASWAWSVVVERERRRSWWSRLPRIPTLFLLK